MANMVNIKPAKHQHVSKLTLAFSLCVLVQLHRAPGVAVDS